MPERRTSSVTSFLSDLHFSGKVIMASILFGFGLLLVGAILLVIATGGQSSPPLKENAAKTPMTFVGPGVMGVGAFFVIVGTIMCLFETRILRRRKHTDHDSLINAEIVPTGNSIPPSTETQDHVHEEGDKDLEETEIKTVHVECHIQSSVKNTEKVPVESGAFEKDTDNELSTSTEREQASAFNSSVYVDAVGESDNDDDGYDEQQFVTESTQFSTPPEGKSEEVLKASFDGRSDMGYDDSKLPYSPATGTGLTAEPIKMNLLPVPKENESSLPLPNDSNSSKIPTHSSVKENDLTEEILHPLHDRDSQVKGTQINNSAGEELQKESALTVSSTELLDETGKDSSGSDSDKLMPSSAENTDPTHDIL